MSATGSTPASVIEESLPHEGWPSSAGDDVPPGIGPYRLAWRRLRRNKVALAFGGAVPADRDPVPARAGVREARRAHGPEREPHDRQITIGGKLKDVVSPGHPDRADLARAVLPRRRHQRPRRRGPAALRRAQLARDRLRGDADHDVLATLVGDRRGLLPRRRRRRALARARPDLGLPGRAARGRARRRAGRRRPRPRAVQSAGQLADGPGGDHRGHLHPLRGQADPRAGAGPARARVRRRGAAAGAGTMRIMCERDPPERRLDDHRVHPADHRQRDPDSRRACRSSAPACRPRTRLGGR